MSTFFNWIKSCFKYYFGKPTNVIISKIEDNCSNIPQDVKKELIQSIIMNKPDKFVEQLNDKKNQVPENVVNELMKSVRFCDSTRVEQIPEENRCIIQLDVCDPMIIKPVEQQTMNKNQPNICIVSEPIMRRNRHIGRKSKTLRKVIATEGIMRKRNVASTKPLQVIPMDILPRANNGATNSSGKQPSFVRRNQFQKSNAKATNRHITANKILKMECKWNQHY